MASTGVVSNGSLRLPPEVVEFTRKRLGLPSPGLLDGAALSLGPDGSSAIPAGAPPGVAPGPTVPPDVAAYVAAKGGTPPAADTASTDASSQRTGVDAYMASMRDYVNRYASPDALAAAQAKDRADVQSARFAQAMNAGTGLMINNPGALKTPDAVPMEVRQFMERAGLAEKGLGLQGQMLQMDPRSPVAQAKISALRAAGIDVPEGTSPMVADAYLGALKAGVDVSKLQAEVGKIRGETAVSGATVPKLNAETLEALHRIGLTDAQINEINAKIPLTRAQTAETTAKAKQASAEAAATVDLNDPQSSRSRILVNLGKTMAPDKVQEGMSGADVIKVLPELSKYGVLQAEHPREVNARWEFKGQGFKNEAEAQAFRSVEGKAFQLDSLIRQYKDLLPKEGEALGVWSGKRWGDLKTLHGLLLIASKELMDAKAFTHSDQALADKLIPEGTGAEGVYRRADTMRAQLDTLAKNNRARVEALAKGSNYGPTGTRMTAPDGTQYDVTDPKEVDEALARGWKRG